MTPTTYNDAYSTGTPAPATPVKRVREPDPDAVETDPVRFGGTFTWGYRGPRTCASCPASIQPGDDVHRGLDGRMEHATCPDPLTIPKQGVCTGCWLVLPVTGVCGVC